MHFEISVRVNSITTVFFRIRVKLMKVCFLQHILFLIYVNRIVLKSDSCDGIKIGDRCSTSDVCESSCIT